jgi:hypothetical protein
MQIQPMKANSSCDQHGPELVDIIEFKWLMAGAGHQVHVERLQADRDYAEHCLASAEAAHIPALRAAAARLRKALQQHGA